MEENQKKPEDEFNVLDDEVTDEFSPVPEDKFERKEEIIPLYKRHVFTLIVAAVIVFIFGGILGYSFGKNAGKREIINEKLNLAAKESELPKEKMMKPQYMNEQIVNLTDTQDKPVSNTSKEKESVSTEEKVPAPVVEKPTNIPPPKKEPVPSTPAVSNDESVPPVSPFIESTEKLDRYVQIASFKERKQAEEAKSKYEKDGYSAIEIKEIEIKDKGTWYRVILGPVTLSYAKQVKTEFSQKYKIDVLIK